jgi:GR25 family glycosyltransferase involved in LPS biosynthesis
MSISLICACKNRNSALNVSLNSWLNHKEITEIIIVDWSSDESLEHLISLDERIKIIRVQNQKYFNQPQPLNLAVSVAKGDYILKVDCDYVFNCYYSFFDKYKIDSQSFVSGKSSIVNNEFYDERTGNYIVDRNKMSLDQLTDYYNSYSSYYRFLTGLLFVSKENFLKVGGYNEDFCEYYSFEDDEIYKRLEMVGLEHKKMDFDYHVFHIPHPDTKRVENFKSSETDKDLRETIRINLSNVYFGDELEWQTDYVLTMEHNRINSQKLENIVDYYNKSNTEWVIDEQKDRFYIASIKEETDNDFNKLKNFPPVHYVSIENSTFRRKKLYEKFKKYGVTNITSHIFKRYNDDEHVILSDYLNAVGQWKLSQGSRGPVTSHLKAIKQWLNSTNDEYAFFCEDDLSLQTVEYWNFTWEEFMDILPPKWDCIQLCLLREYYTDYLNPFEFRKRWPCDWSCCAYLITREYAQKLIDTYYYDDYFHLDCKCYDVDTRPDWAVIPVVETIILGLTNRVYVYPLFVEDVSFKSSYEIENVTNDLNDHHYNSHNTILNWWKEMGFKLTSDKIIPNKIKFVDFPSVYYISLEESVDRREKLHKQFLDLGVTNLHGIISKRFHECDDVVYGKQLHILDSGTTGCCISHLKAIKKWYEETEDDYAFFCEDDLSLETVEYWNFTWNDFIENLPEDAECVQLCCINENQQEVKIRNRSMMDWSVTAYILTRDYARKIIETYIEGDCYKLEIPGTDFYPMPENLLFYNLGKVYSVNLFVEDQNLKSTFYGHSELEKENKDYHVETYEHVIGWWKKNYQSKILDLVESNDEISISRNKTDLEVLLTEYSLDPENPQRNYDLGLWYEKEGHTAPALSYFLRASERYEDENMIYESLIKCHHCYDKQGTRDGTAISLLQQALCTLPNRPEAYFLLARFHERRHQWNDCYKYASLGLSICELFDPSTTSDVEYPGKYGLLFEKALSGWYWGKVEESKNIFVSLSEDDNVGEDYYDIIVENLKHYDIHLEKKI